MKDPLRANDDSRDEGERTRRDERRRGGGSSSFPTVLVLVVIGGVTLTIVGVALVVFFAARGLGGHAEARLVEAKRSMALAEITHLHFALDEYALMNMGRYPDTLEALAAPDASGAALVDRDETFTDPWGNAYLYDPPGQNSTDPRIYSYGADGVEGGEGDDADIDSVGMGR